MEKMYSLIKIDYLSFNNEFSIAFSTYVKNDNFDVVNTVRTFIYEAMETLKHGITTASQLCELAVNSEVVSSIILESADRVSELAMRFSK